MKALKRIQLREAIRAWLKYIENHCAATTYDNYRRIIYQFIDFMPTETYFESLTTEHIEQFLASLHQQKSSINL